MELINIFKEKMNMKKKIKSLILGFLLTKQSHIESNLREELSKYKNVELEVEDLINDIGGIFKIEYIQFKIDLYDKLICRLIPLKNIYK